MGLTNTLGQRLLHLDKVITRKYQHIWDCCCDHGYLGMRLLERKAAEQIHFVDLVADITSKLEQRLSNNYPKQAQTPQWHVHCLDASHLPIRAHSGDHLIILAGIGGELCKEIVLSLHSSNVGANIDFLLCPIRQHFGLRSTLRECGFNCINESLVEENNRTYEVLMVSGSKRDAQNGELITQAGRQIWQAKTDDQFRTAEQYRQNLIAHYTRKIKAQNKEAERALESYQNISVQRL